ncbi:hypothetical protein TNIN_272341 [Trichonephila inaurata madagascariensis]|uniref:Uncharacterized protein n=1 Tax=Trichonephila inaurata madagascariensis TaxID=2747483 RepID=A0A8X6YEQ6_9ARAC|nr:hypothetical protein TNIN_272341 [Trichonephila inaurata madagascariensis]
MKKAQSQRCNDHDLSKKNRFLSPKCFFKDGKNSDVFTHNRHRSFNGQLKLLNRSRIATMPGKWRIRLASLNRSSQDVSTARAQHSLRMSGVESDQ